MYAKSKAAKTQELLKVIIKQQHRKILMAEAKDAPEIILNRTHRFPVTPTIADQLKMKNWISETHRITNRMLWFIVRFDPHFRHAVGINSSPDQTEWVKKVLRFIDQNPKFKKQWNRDASEWTLGLKKLFYRDLFATQKNAHQLDMKAACPMKIVANAVMRLISNISACLTNLEKNQEKRRLKPWYRKYRFKIRYRPVKHIQNGVMYIDRDKYRSRVSPLTRFRSRSP
jgi:hypothetical protein